MVSFSQWGANSIKYVQRNPELSSIKIFVGIQMQQMLVIKFDANTGESINVLHEQDMANPAI